MKLYKIAQALLVIALLFAYPFYRTLHAQPAFPLFGLLVPQSAEKLLPTQIWMDAAREEGVPLEIVRYEDLIGAFQHTEFLPRVILIPDEVSKFAPATLIPLLQKYVEEGGRLALVSDAISEDFNGNLLETFPRESYFHFPKVTARQGDTLQFAQSPLQITDEWIRELRIPPGVYTPSEFQDTKASVRELCTYQSPHNPYPHWLTTPAKDFNGKTLLEAEDGSLVAGLQTLGKGQALWINLPLTYLVRRTDGLLLHSFLRWISEDWAGLPRLLPVPDGIGGIVLNIHVDSNAAIDELNVLKKADFFSDGPYSIHLTAGPDARTYGDKLGFDLPGKESSRDWVHYWFTKGHAVGSHGGWIHDYFGTKVPAKSTPEFENLLEQNRAWLEKLRKKPVLEYSSPMGNHPLWITQWLEAHGFNSYYFTGNNGLGPTQNYLDDAKIDQSIWAFPISPYQQVASFEEANDIHLSGKEYRSWLDDLRKFVVATKSSRLFYFHPPGLHFYGNLLTDWVKDAHPLMDHGVFHWYTMSHLAKFFTAQKAEHWHLQEAGGSHLIQMTIEPAAEREHFAWTFPKSGVKNISLVSGKARLQDLENEVQVHPESTNETVIVQFEEKNP